MPLTEQKIRSFRPEPGKKHRLFDGRGLYLEISPTGGTYWRWKYHHGGKERRLAVGVYPDIKLKDARQLCDEARKLLSTGVDPVLQRKKDRLIQVERSGETFEKVGREWYAKQAEVWVPAHASRILSRLERDIFPFLGDHPITEIKAPELVAVFRRMEARGVRETVHRARQDCEAIFNFAISAGKCENNPAVNVTKALAPKPEPVNFAAVTEPDELGELLRKIDSFQGTFTVFCALRLAPYLPVRPGELRKAKWKEINLEKAEWGFVASKTRPQLIVPLSRQVIAILRKLHQVTGSSPYVFPGARSDKRPMSENAVLYALRSLGIPKELMTGHGFRATFRTIGDEVLKLRVDLIEHQLAHKVKDSNGRAYNRTAFLADRKLLMQEWSDYLDHLRGGGSGELIEFQRRA
jgi:integrase